VCSSDLLCHINSWHVAQAFSLCRDFFTACRARGSVAGLFFYLMRFAKSGINIYFLLFLPAGRSPMAREAR
jgi:hypothetical protein